MNIPNATEYPTLAATTTCPMCGHKKSLGKLLCGKCDAGFRELEASNGKLLAQLKSAEKTARDRSPEEQLRWCLNRLDWVTGFRLHPKGAKYESLEALGADLKSIET